MARRGVRPEKAGGGYTALGGVLGAGSLVVLWLACAAPSGRLGLTAAAGLFPMAATLYAGRPAGYLCWGAASLLGLILLPDKRVALLFFAFLGLYPVVKGAVESLRRLPVEWALKLLFFNGVLTACWFAFRELFLPHPPAWLGENSLLLYGGGNVIFILYDTGLSRLVGMLRARLGFGRGPGRRKGE